MAEMLTFTKYSKWNINGKIFSYTKGQRLPADSLPPRVREDMLTHGYATLTPIVGKKEQEPHKNAKVVNPVAENKEADLKEEEKTK